jgi:hypothetical protein
MNELVGQTKQKSFLTDHNKHSDIMNYQFNMINKICDEVVTKKVNTVVVDKGVKGTLGNKSQKGNKHKRIVLIDKEINEQGDIELFIL